MTNKELRRLNRRDLLQLLLAQGEEAEQTKQQLEETTAQLSLTSANYERLRKRLDMKDAQIRELRDALQTERTRREIELKEAGNIAEAALRLNGIFQAAQEAADQYLYNIRLLSEGGIPAPAPLPEFEEDGEPPFPPAEELKPGTTKTPEQPAETPAEPETAEQPAETPAEPEAAEQPADTPAEPEAPVQPAKAPEAPSTELPEQSVKAEPKKARKPFLFKRKGAIEAEAAAQADAIVKEVLEAREDKA